MRETINALVSVLVVGAVVTGLVFWFVGAAAAKRVALAAVALAVLGAVVVGVGFLRSWTRLRGSDARAPGAVEPGPVEVEGTAEPLDGTLSAPRTDGVESLVYEHHVEVRSEDEAEKWRTRDHETEGVPFLVRTGSAGTQGESVVVDPDDATLVLERAKRETGANGRVRHTVDRLDAGEEVYVSGEAVPARVLDAPTSGQEYAVTEPDTRLPGPLRRVVAFPFVVSDRPEEEAERMLLLRGVGTLAGALLGGAVLYVLADSWVL